METLHTVLKTAKLLREELAAAEAKLSAEGLSTFDVVKQLLGSLTRAERRALLTAEFGEDENHSQDGGTR